MTYLLGLNFNFGESNRGLFFQPGRGVLDFLFFLVKSTSDSSTLKDFPRGGLRWRIYGERFSGRDPGGKHVEMAPLVGESGRSPGSLKTLNFVKTPTVGGSQMGFQVVVVGLISVLGIRRRSWYLVLVNRLLQPLPNPCSVVAAPISASLALAGPHMAGPSSMSHNLGSGYPSHIFTAKTPPSLECSICMQVKRDPVSLCTEGHTFCRACLTRARTPMRFKCPTCRENISKTDSYTKSRAEKEIIEELITKCEYATPQSSEAAAHSTATRKRTRGATSSSMTPATEYCMWTGPLEKRDAHIAECEYALITCKFAGCHENVRRKDQAEHEEQCPRRPVECTLCNKLVASEEMDNHAERQCTKRLVACPNKCGEQMKAADMETHVEKHCKMAIVSCPYASLGCCWKKNRREKLREHLNDASEDHARLQVEAIERNIPPKIETTVRWKLTNARDRISASSNSAKLYSSRFHVSGEHFRLYAYLREDETTFRIAIAHNHAAYSSTQPRTVHLAGTEFHVTKLKEDGGEVDAMKQRLSQNVPPLDPTKKQGLSFRKTGVLNCVRDDGSIIFKVKLRVALPPTTIELTD